MTAPDPRMQNRKVCEFSLPRLIAIRISSLDLVQRRVSGFNTGQAAFLLSSYSSFFPIATCKVDI